MIRPIKPADLPKLTALQADRGFGPDFMGGVVLVDANGEPKASAGAWQRAEVHIAMGEFESPAAKYLALTQLHDALERELLRWRVGQVVTWFAESEICSPFLRRLRTLGWVVSTLRSVHRRVG